MRIVGVGGSRCSASATRRGEGDVPASNAIDSDSRALIAVEAAAPSQGAPHITRHPGAGFLTQLIATRMQAPQTRVRWRAEPEDAIAVYRSMTKPVPYRRAFGKRA